MDFKFSYKVEPENLWFISMYNIYKSMAGTVNIIFTISMVLLAFRFWPEQNLLTNFCITVGILLFPIFQPLFIFLRSRKLVSTMPGELEMTINSDGLSIASEKSQTLVKLTELKSILKIRGMLILQTNTGQSYILNKKALNGDAERLFGFLSKAMGK